MDARPIDIESLWLVPGILPPRIAGHAPPGFRELPLWDPFEAYVGPFYMTSDQPVQTAAFIVRHDHLDGSGACDPGMLLTFADSCSATMAWNAAGRRNAVTLELSAQFGASARLGDTVTFVCTSVGLLGETVLLAARIESGGQTVALVNSRWRIIGSTAVSQP
ncbi:MAG TPA: hotdog domain-containing protein [Allosphingosinicella sp.]|nr:hotdog domain-containing protein [Allosphingosinicella sp.]